MRPYAKSIIELFDGKKRYLIPLYQRQYAWRVQPQLELLWEDLERAVMRLASDRASSAPHFMGAIVIAEVKTFDKQVRAYEVIDGQQRLTTFQLLLASLRDVAAANNSSYAAEINKHLLNDGVMETSHVERYKLWPTATDRRAFVQLIDPSADLAKITAPAIEEESIVRPAVAAHAWFRARIEKHVGEGEHFDEFRLEKLFEALKSGLAAVSIELETGDDPQTIFETLNSRGVDLTAGDLMRNFIFQRAKGMGQKDGSLNIDELYQTYWLPLDGWFWREGETRGRLTRPRLDWLLVDHLAMQKADLISADQLFETYRRWILTEQPFANVTKELQAIAASAAVHRRIAEAGSDVLGKFGRFAQAFDVSTAMPLALYLVTGANLDGAALGGALGMIESFILRRDICALPTGNYNRLFVMAIERMRGSNVAPANALEQHLSSSSIDTARWPDNEEWKQSWLGRDQYKPNRQGRLRYLFEAVERAKRSTLNENIEIKSALTIEHIMPRKWRQHWPVSGFNHLSAGEINIDQITRESERDQCVDKLGNLTLLTSALNSSASNAAFEIKMPKLKAQTSLALNRELHSYEHWNETSITHRGAALFDVAQKLWRSPKPVQPVQALGLVSPET